MTAPALQRASSARLDLQGPVGAYLANVTEQWLLPAPLANPAILEMFRDRDEAPLRGLLPWSGEFAGKHLTASIEVWRVTRDPRLRDAISLFVGQLLRCQDEDGYLGPFPKHCRLCRHVPNADRSWDAWGHYHISLGLLQWYEETRDERALSGAVKIGDLLCRKFLNTGVRVSDMDCAEMNHAILHSLCLLYRVTNTPRYLQLARSIVAEFPEPTPDGKRAGDYVRGPLSGQEFFELPRPRWESLHAIMGLAELHWLTGEDDYRQAFERIWWSIVKLDRHNNGGFSSGEQAKGNPYDPAAIETCCTIAWMALSVEMLKMSGDSIVADELELSLFNSVLGMHSSSGRWACYCTPMNGVRQASAHQIVFQAREGSPELNCCSVNSPRGLGLLSAWALMQDGGDLLLNFYGPGSLHARLDSGVDVCIQQKTDYPVGAQVVLTVTPSRTETFSLKLRIPHWSARTEVRINGVAVTHVVPGSYLNLKRAWQPGDQIVLQLDMSLHAWSGERECAGLTSLYRGPILLTYDRRYNLKANATAESPVSKFDLNKGVIDCGLNIPTLDAHRLNARVVKWDEWLSPLLLLDVSTEAGHAVKLCDFASGGSTGTPYQSWLPVVNAAPTHFSHAHPLRSGPLK